MATEGVKDDTNNVSMPSNYKASLSTGIYGFYRINNTIKAIKQSLPPYKPSLSTGIYGFYRINNTTKAIKQSLPPYKPSYSSGVYGSYTMGYSQLNKSETKKIYTYFPSISSGIFGTWKYNETSPYKIIQIKQITKTTKTKSISTKKKQGSIKTSSGYGWYRKKEPKHYKFEIQGPRNETIKNGKKYNVKLLQQYTLSMGEPLINIIKKSKVKQQENDDEQKNDDKSVIGTGDLFICEGSVVSFSGECIINAANEGMLGGGGVDGAISSAGGDALYYLRQKVLPIDGSKHVRCKTGDAKITQSGYPYNRLKCDYVIHAVGPNYSMMHRGGKQMKMTDIDELLYNSYAKSMILCKQYNIKSVGFCLISSGIFRGPRSLDDVLRIGIEAIRDYMFHGIEVYIIGYTYSELSCLAKMAPKTLGTPIKEYQKVKERKSWGSPWNMNKWSRNNNDDNDNDNDEEGESGFFSNWGWGNKKNKNKAKDKGKGNKGKRGEALGKNGKNGKQKNVIQNVKGGGGKDTQKKKSDK